MMQTAPRRGMEKRFVHLNRGGIRGTAEGENNRIRLYTVSRPGFAGDTWKGNFTAEQENGAWLVQRRAKWLGKCRGGEYQKPVDDFPGGAIGKKKKGVQFWESTGPFGLQPWAQLCRGATRALFFKVVMLV